MAAELTAAGHIRAVPDLTGAVTGPGPHWPAFVRRATEAAPAGEQTLVVHGNAGLLVPALADAVPDVRRVVFVDAALPGAPLPAAHLAALRELTGPDGLLPPGPSGSTKPRWRPSCRTRGCAPRRSPSSRACRSPTSPSRRPRHPAGTGCRAVPPLLRGVPAGRG
ncbi:hypothetical protein [Streptomyces huasconensis]|uniref:hypothetical protein n=1 Tax=Streptomyces huasconensis TaxID=1854574 RepID=UPI0036F9E57A